MPMSNVLSCSVLECIYNQNRECHATSITIGEDHPNCDTFSTSQSGMMIQENVAGVSECMVETCKYNDNLNCGAPGITVGHHSNHADCNTFLSI